MSAPPFNRADTLPTPHPPGFFPDTPAGDQYNQNEGPLEDAGRSLAPAILVGAGSGLALGGIVGAVIGAGVASLTSVEKDGLQEKLHDEGAPQVETIKEEEITTPAANASDVGDIERHEKDLTAEQMATSPIQREVGGTGEEMTQLLGGATGAAVVDNELSEPSTELVSEKDRLQAGEAVLPEVSHFIVCLKAILIYF